MKPLEKLLRNKLEHTVQEARECAETAARIALEQIGVNEASPFNHLSPGERQLRKSLRIHGRQSGDTLDPISKKQEIKNLIEEAAYEHWHRMLFARFLAENDLLMHEGGSEPVPITLAECDEIALEEKAKNGWELASRYAAKMLPQIFRFDSPVFQLALPPEHQQKLEQLLQDLPSEIFIASDSLGWVYQFWQSKKKKEINDSEIKIGARELPAMTQLFTEPYMVNFLLDNSLGAWWSARSLTDDDLKNANSEDELRSRVSLPGMPLEYLRFIKENADDSLKECCNDNNASNMQSDYKWIAAAGWFEKWPDNLSELKLLDPFCGSGHFLVAALLMLVPMRMAREGLSPQESIDLILHDNLHGMDIDKRAVEIAAFALALIAWRYPNAGGYRQLPELNLACSGISVGGSKEEWKQLATDKNISSLSYALEFLYDEFSEAPLLGSLLNPAINKIAIDVDERLEDLALALKEALSREQDEEKREMGIIAHGIAKAAELLLGKYHLIITNVPYLARSKQDSKLKDYCEKNYKDAKNDLATVFLSRCLEFCHDHGTISIVLPQNWLFLTTYRKFRERLLMDDSFRLIARLGAGGFQTPMWDFNVQLLIIDQGKLKENNTLFLNDISNSIAISGLDVSFCRSAIQKANMLKTIEIMQIDQENQLQNPDCRIALGSLSSLPLLNRYADCFTGILNGDSPHFQKKYWEIDNRSDLWAFQQSTIQENKTFGGLELVIYFDKKQGHLREDAKIRRERLHDSDQRGNRCWGNKGIGISQMRILPVSLYIGETFDSNIAVILPKDQKLVLPIWTYCQSENYHKEIRKIDQKLNVTNATLAKVPFDLEYWQQVAEEKYPIGLPKPYSEDPTQWIFHGHPAKSENPLQVAVARMLGYRWPSELDPNMELAEEARTWIKKCEELEDHADEDGIICIPAIRGEIPAVDRLLNILADSYGSEWNKDKLSELLKQADHHGKSLESWLRDKFFIQHCKLFHHRPFIWHIWDGLNDGFSALLNYHKLDDKNLENLTYTYLADWIVRQKEDMNSGIDGAHERLDAAESLKKKLKQILEGEAPYDIFIRWKPIEQQSIGWNPDINDGVRLNIRPFMTAPDVKKKGAGILRDKPNIDWGKDRGKDAESAPWYSLFKGDRINDHHLTLEEKRKARQLIAKEQSL